MYTNFLRNLWTAYGFRDAFNLDINWWDTDELGIDQGPIIIMIENYRTQKVWQLFMRNAEVQRGLQRAGFVSLPSIPSTLQTLSAQSACNLIWNGIVGRVYQIEYSPDLESWFVAPTGELTATNTTVAWVDNGPPGTGSAPLDTPQRFYRVIKYGPP
jgi:hypothetical protein